MNQMAIVGDGDSIMVFKATGVDVYPAENVTKAKEILRRVGADYQILFLTENLGRDMGDFLKRFDDRPYPVVLVVPTAQGGNGYGDAFLKSAMEKALGVDILFNKVSGDKQ